MVVLSTIEVVSSLVGGIESGRQVKKWKKGETEGKEKRENGRNIAKW